jgi:hypothetical protein
MSLVVIGLATAASSCGAAPGSVPKRAAAVVDGQQVTRVELQQALLEYNRSAADQGRPTVRCCSSNYQQLVRNVLLPALILQVELEQQARRAGVVVRRADIDAEVRRLVRQDYHGKADVFVSAMEKRYGSIGAARGALRTQVLKERLVRRVEGNVHVAEHAAHEFYTAHPELYRSGPARKVALFHTRTLVAARALRRRLAAGVPAANLLSSTDGRILVVLVRDLTPGLGSVALSLRRGATSAPQRVSGGWEIVQAVGPVISDWRPPFAAVRERVIRALTQQQRLATLTSWEQRTERYYAKRVAYAAGLAPARPSNQR